MDQLLTQFGIAWPKFAAQVILFLIVCILKFIQIINYIFMDTLSIFNNCLIDI
jgi:hypothetical protein